MKLLSILVETVREKDSLALSSRNSLLSKESRLIVPTLYDTLKKAISRIKKIFRYQGGRIICTKKTY